MLAACTTLQDLHQYTNHLSKDLKESPEQPNDTKYNSISTITQ